MCLVSFLLSVQEFPSESKPSKNINIKKWHKQVRIRIAGLNKIKNSKTLDKYLSQLLPYMPQDFAVTDKYNYLVMFTDSIEGELKNEFSSIFDATLGKNTILDAYKKSSDKKCYYIHLQSDEENYSINSYFAFIQSDHPNLELCFKEIFYAGFGPSNAADSNIWNSHKNTDKYSDLELIIMFILNTEYIKHGMSYEQLSQAFESAYKDAINFIKITGDF